MNQALKIPGLSNSWTMPIRGRIDMLNTGIRTPVGLKIQGADLNKMQEIEQQQKNSSALCPALETYLRTRRRCVLSRCELGSPDPGPPGALHGRRPERPLDRSWRGKPQHRDQSEGTVHCQPPLSSRLPVGLRIARPRVCARDRR